MPQLVIDASVCLKWFVREVDAAAAAAILTSNAVLYAPDFSLLEIANGLRTSVALGRISRDDARRAMTAVPRYFAQFIPANQLVAEAFDLAILIGHPVYDCLYLVAAMRAASPLVTADQKFVTKLAGTPYAKSVVLLSDWAPP